MTTLKRYSMSAHTIYNIGYHLIWCTKYRTKVLTGSVETRLKELMREKGNELGIEIISMETMPEHIHLFIKAKQIHSPHFIVQQLKGYSSKILRSEFYFLKSRIPTLWTRSYYCESVGHISDDTIIKYIEDQKNK